jgi:hypothetical protein
VQADHPTQRVTRNWSRVSFCGGPTSYFDGNERARSNIIAVIDSVRIFASNLPGLPREREVMCFQHEADTDIAGYQLPSQCSRYRSVHR